LPTLEDVAKIAGVSARTVSRVINNEKYVSAQVRERVRRAMAQVRYTPNIVARGMVTKKTGLIALSLSVITSPLVVPLIKGVMDETQRRGYQLVLCETGEKRAEDLEYLQLSRSGLVDAVILASRILSMSVPYGIEEISIISMVNYHLPQLNRPQFVQDVETDAYMLARHLIAQGAKEIAYFGGPKGRPSSQLKLKGLRKALTENGIPYYPELTWFKGYAVDDGRAAMNELLKLHLPDAVFAGNDLIGIGAIQVAKEKKLKIPDDISICGFDNHPFSEYTDPPLTSVRPDMYGMGKMAVDACLMQIERRKKSPEQTAQAPQAAQPQQDLQAQLNQQPILVPGELVIRKSTKIVKDDGGVAGI
jgi:LacI family transcriptional regulator